MGRLTWRGLRAHKLRFLLTALSIALGISLLSGTLIYSATITRTFDDMFEQTNEHVDAVVRSTEQTESTFGDQRARVDLALVDRLRSLPSVASVSPEVSGYAQLVDRNGDALGGFGPPTLGLSWTDDPDLNEYTLVTGRGPETGEVVIDKASADKGGFHLGDTIKVLTRGPAETFTLVGVVRYGSADSPAGATLAVFDLDTALRLVSEPGKVDAFSVSAVEGVSREALRDEVARALPEGQPLEAITGDQLVTENRDLVAQSMSFISTFMLVFGLIALFVGAFIIYNTFSIIVSQRTRELGLLRALGASRRQITGSVAGEALVLGTVASIVGVASGAVLAQGLKALMSVVGFNIPTTALSFPIAALAWSVLGGIVITVVASLLPARRASRLTPLVAMTGGQAESGTIGFRRIAVGIALLVAGITPMAIGLVAKPSNALLLAGVGAAVVFLGVAQLAPAISRPVSRVLGGPFAAFGSETGHIAQENAMRNPRRTASTAAALMVGVALVGTISVVAASTQASTDDLIEQAWRTDFMVVPKGGIAGFSTGGFTPDVATKLRALPEIAAVSPVRTTFGTVAGANAPIGAVDPASFTTLVDLGAVEGSMTSMAADSIAVSEQQAAEHGWQVGQTISVDVASGGDVPVRIAAIFERREIVGDYLVALAFAESNFRDRLDNQLIVKLTQGVDPGAGRLAIEQVTAQYENLQLYDQTDYKEQLTNSVNQLLALIYALLILAVIIAVLGITNTLVLSVHERGRELGLLRAVGMTRGQISRAIGFESIIIALFGTALGLVIGSSFGVALVAVLRDEGVTKLVVPATTVALVAVLAVVAGVAASLGPARRAAKVDILRAIASE